MASVVLNQLSGNDQVYATGLLAGGKGVVSKGVVSAEDRIAATGQITITGSIESAGTTPTTYALDNNDTNGGGLVPNHLQIFGYFDPAVASAGVQEFMDAYPAVIGGTAPATGTQSVFRVPNSIPLNNWAAPFIGTITGTGAALVVPCAGIPAAATLRVYLVGFVGAAGATAVVAPTWSVQANVSFTITATTGAIYSYEVLFA